MRLYSGEFLRCSVVDIKYHLLGFEEWNATHQSRKIFYLIYLESMGGSPAHSPTLPSLYLRHNSFSNPSITSPTSQLVLQTFRRFTYVTTNSPTLPSLHLRHNSFFKPSVALPTSQLIIQPFHCFTYVIGTSPTSPGEPPMPL